MPVVQRSQKERIVDKVIDTKEDVGKKHFLTLKHAYRDAGYFSLYVRELQRIYSAALYQYAEEGTVGGGFDQALLEKAFRSKD